MGVEIEFSGNSGAMCFSIQKDCYNPFESYGEICVGCNCCGRREKGLKMWKARLYLHKRLLKEDLAKKWDTEFQEKNRQSDIKWNKKKIEQIKKKLKNYKHNEKLS